MATSEPRAAGLRALAVQRGSRRVDAGRVPAGRRARIRRGVAAREPPASGRLLDGGRGAGLDATGAGAHRHRQPGDPPSGGARHGGRDAGRARRRRAAVVLGVGAAEWTMRALGYEPPGWRPYTNVVETVRALRRWLDGEPLGFTPTTFPRRCRIAARLRPAVAGAHRRRCRQRTDDGGRGRVRRRGPAGRPRQSCVRPVGGRATGCRRGARRPPP